MHHWARIYQGELKVERVRVSVNSAKRNRVEGDDEENGLFSSPLDFERAGSESVGEAMSSGGRRGQRKEGEKRSSHRAGSEGKTKGRRTGAASRYLGGGVLRSGICASLRLRIVCFEVVDDGDGQPQGTQSRRPEAT